MAVTYTCEKKNSNKVQAKWSTITENDTVTDVFENPGYPDCTVQVTGTYGGATIAIHGSTNGVDYELLTDGLGSDILATSGSVNFRIEQAPEYIKPVRTNGSSTDLDVTLIAYK